MKLTLVIVVLILLALFVWYRQAIKAQGVRNSRYKALWFAAVKRGDASEPYTLASGVEVSWKVKGSLAFISSGSTDPYWDTMMLLGSNDSSVERPLKFSHDVSDAYLVRLQAYRAPALVLSVFSIMHKIGIWKKPPNEANINVDTSMIRADIGPSKDAISLLFEEPFDQRPMMVNFLKYYDHAQYPDDASEARAEFSGRLAYNRYGDIASTTIYSLGGEYVLGGYIKEVLRRAVNGPSIGEWDDIAVMQYPNQTAILTMEQVEAYRNALRHRNAGLERTVIIAATTD